MESFQTAGMGSSPGRSAVGGMDGPARVLLLDDDGPERLGLLMLLEELGFEVRTAGSVTEAAVVARHFKPDLALIDAGLNDGAHGQRALQVLRHSRGALPALMICGPHALAPTSDAMTAGPTGYLAKPVRPARLLQAIRHLSA